MIFVRGAGSAIAEALAELTTICPVKRNERMPDGERYLFCAGLLYQKHVDQLTVAEITESMEVNYLGVRRECDRLIEENPHARICVMGSESGYRGSFDSVYASAKASLHRYVESKRLKYPGQQLVCVAPSIILNTGMTNARNEDGLNAMERRRLEHPKRRFLQPMEVARMVHFLLCVDEGFTTGVTIRMTGGEHCASR